MRYLLLALRLIKVTRKSITSKKHAAALVCRGKIFNPRCNDPGIHAEDRVTEFMNKRYSTVLIIRSENDTLKNSKPCKMCIELLRDRGIKRVAYSTGDPTDPIRVEKIDDLTNEWTTTLYRKESVEKRLAHVCKIPKSPKRV